jgi:hypothetical protein
MDMAAIAPPGGGGGGGGGGDGGGGETASPLPPLLYSKSLQLRSSESPPFLLYLPPLQTASFFLLPLAS